MRPEKAGIVTDLQGKLNASPFLLVADYTGLRVAQFGELRTRLAGAGAECRVVKNTFLRRAAKEVGLPDFGSELKGQTAIVIGERDVAAAAKVLKSFTAEFKKPVMKIGVVDRAVLSGAQIAEIADLPAREILQAQLLGTLLSPASTLVRLLNEPAASLARVLQARVDQAPAEAVAATPEAQPVEAAAPEAAAPEAAAPEAAAPEAAAPEAAAPEAAAPEAAAPEAAAEPI